MQLRPYWWGILGLIGWAYLGVATVYLLAGDRPAILAGAIALFYCVALADAAGSMAWLQALRPIVRPVIGTHGALVLAGALLGVLLKRQIQDGGSAWRFAARMLGYAAALGAAGVLLRSLNGLAPGLHHQQEPCDGALGPRLVGSHLRRLGGRLRARGHPGPSALAPLLRDRRREPARRLSDGAVPALALRSRRAPLRRDRLYAALGETTGIGLVRSAVFAWLVVRLSGWLRSRGVRVQL